MKLYLKVAALIIVLIIACITPFVLSKYYTFVFAMTFCFAIYALGYNVLLGRTGLLSFGHALYLGVGAYTVGFLMSPDMGPYRIMSMELLLLFAIIFSAIMGLAVGSLVLRYTRIFFGVLNLAIVMVWYSLLLKLYDITGGTDGLPIYIPTLFGMELGHEAFRTFVFYYYVFAIFCILAFIVWRIYQSPLGLALKAIRENGVRAEFVGIPIGRYKLTAFVISAIYGGIAGALWAPLSGQVSPDISTWLTSGDVAFMNILGGMHYFAGPIVGAFVFYHLKVQIMRYTSYWPLVLGSFVIIFAIFLPGGLVGWIDNVKQKLVNRFYR